MLKANNNLDNYAQFTKKQNENVSDCKTSIWQKRSSSIHPSTQVNKDDKIRINNLKDVKNMTMLSIGRQDESGMKRPAAYFVFIMADFLMANFEFLVVAFFKIWRSAVNGFFSVSACTNGPVSHCRNAVPTIRRGEYTEYTHSMHDVNTVCSQARTDTECVTVTQELEKALSHCIIFGRSKESVVRSTMSHPCWSLPHLLPQHAALPGRRDLLQEDAILVQGSRCSRAVCRLLFVCKFACVGVRGNVLQCPRDGPELQCWMVGSRLFVALDRRHLRKTKRNQSAVSTKGASATPKTQVEGGPPLQQASRPPDAVAAEASVEVQRLEAAISVLGENNRHSGNFSAFSGGLAWTVWHHRNSVKENLTARIDFVDSFVYSPVESSMECFVCVVPCAAFMNVAHLFSDYLPSSTCTVYTSVFSSPLCTEFCTCNRPMILTMTDHHCQHWLKKKRPSSPCDLRSCSISSPSAAVIAAYQAEVKSTG